MKCFNTAGICIPEKNYMADTYNRPTQTMREDNDFISVRRTIEERFYCVKLKL